MSSRRTRASTSSNITEDEINDLVFRLQSLLPQYSSSRCTTRAPSKILKETCSYIKSLQKEVDDLSEKLSQLLANMDTGNIDADILRSLLQQ